MTRNTKQNEIESERRILHEMITFYSKRKGVDCSELLEYATCRLSRCRFGNEKPACLYCKVHCYKPTMRKEIAAVMRYSGPRMLFRHPIMTLKHLLKR